MRAMRFIGVAVILCAGIAGQSDAQKRPTNEAADILARGGALNSLIDMFDRCKDRKCDVYKAQVRQTGLDIFLSRDMASRLNARLTADEIQSLKMQMSLNMVNAYYYGKGKQ
jgi:hypothetical protein